MEEKNILRNWKIWLVIVIILIVILFGIYIYKNFSKEVNSDSIRQIQLGDMVSLNEEDKKQLKNKTENYIRELF